MRREKWVLLGLISKSIEFDTLSWSLLLSALTFCMYCWEIWAQGPCIERALGAAATRALPAAARSRECFVSIATFWSLILINQSVLEFEEGAHLLYTSLSYFHADGHSTEYTTGPRKVVWGLKVHVDVILPYEPM